MATQNTLPTPGPTQKEWGGRDGVTADHVRGKGGGINDAAKCPCRLATAYTAHYAEARQVEIFRLNSSLSSPVPEESTDETSGRPKLKGEALIYTMARGFASCAL